MISACYLAAFCRSVIGVLGIIWLHFAADGVSAEHRPSCRTVGLLSFCRLSRHAGPSEASAIRATSKIQESCEHQPLHLTVRLSTKYRVRRAVCKRRPVSSSLADVKTERRQSNSVV